MSKIYIHAAKYYKIIITIVHNNNADKNIKNIGKL